MYSASSIITALQLNPELDCENIDTIICPFQGDTNTPDNCEKGKTQTCKRPVSVHYKYKKLRVLFFRFFVSEHNHSGFIRENDSALESLIRYNYIDRSKLVSVKTT
jgi:hypothetical protein